jgi:predicted kinase
METLLSFVPVPPAFTVDWGGINAQYPWIRALRGCRQDPVWHAEGDVWIHTRMACEALAAMSDWRQLSTAGRELVFVAVLMHDIAKPECTREDGERITSRGHSGRGESLARRILWEMGAGTAMREEVARIIAAHQQPFFAIDREDAARLVHRMSYVARLRHVALVAEADARGRVTADQQRLLDHIELFRELARDQDCFGAPRKFMSDLARFEYFRREHRTPDYDPYDETWGEVLMLSGLPASGKDAWLRTHAPDLPVVSLDDLRAELRVGPEEAQGAVIAAGKERAREYLRRQQAFAWNATNLSRQLRAPLIALFAGYGARIRIVHVEAQPGELSRRNQARPRPVPDTAIERMLARWQVPDATEAHEVLWQVGAEGELVRAGPVLIE